MLFNIFMKPFVEVVQDFGVTSHQYEDDAQLFFYLTPEMSGSVEVLNKCQEKKVG